MVLPVLLGAPRLLITPHLPTIVWSISRGPPKDSRALGLCLNPFKTAVPLWGQTAQISSTLSPKWDCSPERVITRIEDLVPLIPVTFLFGSVRTARLLLFFFSNITFAFQLYSWEVLPSTSFWTSRGHRCPPFSPPATYLLFFGAPRVQHSHCSSIFIDFC